MDASAPPFGFDSSKSSDRINSAVQVGRTPVANERALSVVGSRITVPLPSALRREIRRRITLSFAFWRSDAEETNLRLPATAKADRPTLSTPAPEVFLRRFRMGTHLRG